MCSGTTDMTIETYRLTWEGIEIELTYVPLKWNVIAHLEVRSISPESAPLPITPTGYLSHHHQPGSLEQNKGTVVEQVRRWLDRESKSKAWQQYLEDSRQLSLF